MKYIRTKDGIYEVSNTYIDDWHNKSYKVVGDGSREYCERYDEIVKEADTIEELCDCFSFDDAFVYANPPSLYAFASTARLSVNNNGNSISYLVTEKKREKNHGNLIGYIVIEKNGEKTLEPVAQTNDKGEFKLPWNT